MKLNTPYYLIDERKILKNLKKIQTIKAKSGAKVVLALKCFSTWSVFKLMRQFLDGTTSSSLYEVKLGHDKFGKETHAYSAAFSLQEVKEAVRYADKIIFNSIPQLTRYSKYAKKLELGLRVNPGISYSHFDLADPARKFSRLGVTSKEDLLKVKSMISGVMFHFNCENKDFSNFSSNLDYISHKYKDLLEKLKWVSLGGGLYFTKDGYPIDRLASKLKSFAARFNLQVYLEPGESVITGSAELVTTVLDIVYNNADIAIVDASIEAHMLDLLIYRQAAKIHKAVKGKHKYMVAGCSCLAGDIFGTYKFKSPLKIGSILKFQDAAGYTIVKKNWFNGLLMPSIAVKRLNGSIELIRRFEYKDFLNNLS